MTREGLFKVPGVFLALVISVLVLSSGYSKALTSDNVSGDPAPVDGSALYGGKCSLCHARNGAGLPNWRSKGQPDFTDNGWQKSRSDDQIADTIKNGKGKYMPAFKAKLSEEEIGALVSQIRLFGKRK